MNHSSVRAGTQTPTFAKVVLAVFAVVAALAVPFTAAPRAHAAGTVVWETRVSDRILDFGVSSPNLDAPIKVVRLVVPPGWSKDATRTWPTVWVLHGGFDDHKSWTDKGNLEALTAGSDAIFVLPETSWCSAYSDWYNGGRGGAPAWETYLTDDLRTILENQYRASDVRAVAGNSMGGLGSMKLAAAHPGMFRSAASFSGNVDPLHASGAPGEPDKPGQGCGANWKLVWGDYTVPKELEVWQANDPYVQADKLTGIPLFVSYGRNDLVEQGAYEQNYRFVDRLQQLGATVDERYEPGQGHNWDAWTAQMRNALPMLLNSVVG
ncbi:alpha/beta hydrolase [Nocardia sp. N2S4-5]|uniref:alpha/beta hydrolase n=1 Tax=Nocardia sp. N2S4-5 TaxID=3351565 RepID=UPI0037CFEF65